MLTGPKQRRAVPPQDKKDIEDIRSRFEEAVANTATQVELNKKHEEVLEEINIAHEVTLVGCA